MNNHFLNFWAVWRGQIYNYQLPFLPNFPQICWAQSVQAQSEHQLTPAGHAFIKNKNHWGLRGYCSFVMNCSKITKLLSELSLFYKYTVRESQDNQENPEKWIPIQLTFSLLVFLELWKDRHYEHIVRTDIWCRVSFALASADHALQFLIHRGSGVGVEVYQKQRIRD